MAFCIDQAIRIFKKPVCRLHKQKMLPDVSGIAGMHPVIILAHQLVVSHSCYIFLAMR